MAVFVVVADNGIVDDYIFYFADKIRELVETLVITVNGTLSVQHKNRLRCHCDKIFVRENKGYDCAAFKETLEKFIGWEKVFKYKELMLINDSCYGPIYPLSEMFDTMDEMQYDFWGVTEQIPIKRLYCQEALYPYHIQTYFVVVRNSMLHSESFKEFWSNVRIPNNYTEAVENFELKFTSYFNSLGYSSGAYIDCEAFCKSEEETQAYVFMDSYRLISEYKCPLLKKKVFTLPHETILSSNLGETASKTLAYIQENTNYDTDLIWRCLIRKGTLNNIRTSLHLDFCLSTKLRTEEWSFKKVLLAFFVELELEDKYISYITGLPEYVDVIIYIEHEACLESVKKRMSDHGIRVKSFRCLDHRNRVDFLALEKYEYLCVLNNSKRYKKNLDLVWENLVWNEIYIQNILGMFEKQKRLGIIFPQIWNPGYNTTRLSCGSYIKQLLAYMELGCRVDEQELPFSYGNAFWCRTNALRPLVEDNKWSEYLGEMLLNNTDLMAGVLEKIYPYVAQSQGYYGGVVMTEECASRLMSSYFALLGKQIHNLCTDRGIQEFKNVTAVNPELLEFCGRFKGIYIYGGGEIGYACLLHLQTKGIIVKGFIVSYRKTDDYYAGKKVYTLSEVEMETDIGVVIALSKIHLEEVKGLLEEKGQTNYISYER